MVFSVVFQYTSCNCALQRSYKNKLGSLSDSAPGAPTRNAPLVFHSQTADRLPQNECPQWRFPSRCVSRAGSCDVVRERGLPRKKTKYSGINGDDNRTTDKEGPLIIHMCRGGNKSMIYL